MEKKMKEKFPITIEEKVNSFIHALAVLFALVAFPLLINFTIDDQKSERLISVIIYATCYFLTFSFSALYHWFTTPGWKANFKIFDRISIYFFIAATYTPFIIFYMYDKAGITLLCIMWALALFGVFFELFLVKRLLFISVIFYLVMGWMFIFVSNRFFQFMSADIITLILAGVLLYSLGVIFYVWKKWRFHHAIWHAFVLAGSICHYAAVWLTVKDFSS
jgi:hemolysin III